jgi:transposase
VQAQAITVQLRLPGLAVWGVREHEEAIEVVAQYQATEAACPRCAQPAWQVHQVHRQYKRDAQLWGKQVWILIWKRRFRCRPCRYVFTEPDPACGRRRRTTSRLRATVAHEAEETTIRTVSRRHGVSEGLVQRSWLEAHLTPAKPPTPHVLIGLDGFCVRRPGAMWTGLWDLQTRNPIAVVSGERTADVQRMLERYADRKSVRAVSIDLSEAYRQAVQLVLPDATVVADKFHVIALAGRALREVHGETRRRGNAAWLLQRAVERLRDAEKQQLARVLQQDARLTTAWRLKEELRALYRAPNAVAAGRLLGAWIADADRSGLAPFRRTARTLRRWRREVLHYWRYPITNAVVEGKHNRVKVLKRRAYGYRNDRTFQFRILNLIHTY